MYELQACSSPTRGGGKGYLETENRLPLRLSTLPSFNLHHAVLYTSHAPKTLSTFKLMKPFTHHPRYYWLSSRCKELRIYQVCPLCITSAPLEYKSIHNIPSRYALIVRYPIVPRSTKSKTQLRNVDQDNIRCKTNRMLNSIDDCQA